MSGLPVGPPVPGWEPRPRPEPVTLTGRYVEVRPLSSAQYADLHATLLQAARDYDADVKAGTFPGPEHTF